MAAPLVSMGRIVQYRMTVTDAQQFTDRPGVARQYTAGELLPAIVVTARSNNRCDLQVFIHGPGTVYRPGVPEHYAAEGSWTRIPGTT